MLAFFETRRVLAILELEKDNGVQMYDWGGTALAERAVTGKSRRTWREEFAPSSRWLLFAFPREVALTEGSADSQLRIARALGRIGGTERLFILNWGEVDPHSFEIACPRGRLEELWVYSSTLNSRALAVLCSFPNLWKLQLQELKDFTGEGFPNIANLAILEIGDCELTRAGLNDILKTESLEELDVTCTTVSGADLAGMTGVRFTGVLDLGIPGLTQEMKTSFIIEHPKINLR